jgi:hypothetical protein
LPAAFAAALAAALVLSGLHLGPRGGGGDDDDDGGAERRGNY